MARFHPETLEGQYPNPAEERVFGFLRHVLERRPARVWFRPAVVSGRTRRTPSFVLADPGFGLVVLEVRDWRFEAFAGGGKRRLRLKVDGGERREPHPLQEAARTLAALRKRVAVPRPGFAFTPAAALPAVTEGQRERLVRARFFGQSDRVLTAVLFRESGERGLAAFLEAMGTAAADPPGELDPVWVNRLRSVLQPQIHFRDVRQGELPLDANPAEPAGEPEPSGGAAPPPAAAGVPPDAGGAGTGFFLDRKQERMARGLASPRTVVFGPAGSGKTVFLVARARYWMDLKPGSRILFTCYNASLAAHLRREFRRRGLTVDDRTLTVVHYHDFCRGLLGMGADFHERDPEFYAALEPKVLHRLARGEETALYDLILVDEGQDFTRRMLEVLARVAAPGGEITLVCDPAQDLYGRWSGENPAPLGGHAVERLMDCYRNTAPIFALALAVLSPATRREMGLDRLEMTRPEDLGREGPLPEVHRLGGLDELLTLILGTVEAFRTTGRPLSELALLYPSRDAIPGFDALLGSSSWTAAGGTAGEDPGPVGGGSSALVGTLSRGAPEDAGAPPLRPRHFAEVLERELRARGVPAEWVARDFASKMAYDISKPRLTLSTIHSAKGMDYHTVILVGADALPVAGDDAAASPALLFTGITRARERLIFPCFSDGGWIPRLCEVLDGLGETGGSGG